jgi:Zn-dependent peptidase ImmA (M78 family)
MDRLAMLIGQTHLPRLSRRTGIAQPRLELLARGEEPTYPELLTLASALGVALEQLAPPRDSAGKVQLLFRASGLKQPQTALSDSLSMKIDYALELLGPSASSDWVKSFGGPKETYLDAEVLATEFRRQFYSDDQVSPLVDLPSLLTDKLGVIVFVISSASVDGASAFIDDVPFIFVSSRFPPRMLFTIGHELGHLLANEARPREFALIDNKANLLASGRSRSHQERFAHAFASCLLMPRQGVGVALRTIRELGTVSLDQVGDIELLLLARIFGVSFEAAARRCEDLELLPRGGATSLNQRLKSEYGSAEKRAESLNLPPRAETSVPPIPPALLESAVKRIRTGELSIGRAAAVLGITVGELMAASAAPAR